MTLISGDYKALDFLVSVAYYSATADDTYQAGSPLTIDYCSFFDAVRDDSGGTGDDDIRHTFASLIVRQPEWPGGFTAMGPQRGDAFELDGIIYIVESVDDDLVRLGAWRIKCYSTNSGV